MFNDLSSEWIVYHKIYSSKAGVADGKFRIELVIVFICRWRCLYSLQKKALNKAWIHPFSPQLWVKYQERLSSLVMVGNQPRRRTTLNSNPQVRVSETVWYYFPCLCWPWCQTALVLFLSLDNIKAIVRFDLFV